VGQIWALRNDLVDHPACLAVLAQRVGTPANLTPEWPIQNQAQIRGIADERADRTQRGASADLSMSKTDRQKALTS